MDEQHGNHGGVDVECEMKCWWVKFHSFTPHKLDNTAKLRRTAYMCLNKPCVEEMKIVNSDCNVNNIYLARHLVHRASSGDKLPHDHSLFYGPRPCLVQCMCVCVCTNFSTTDSYTTTFVSASRTASYTGVAMMVGVDDATMAQPTATTRHIIPKTHFSQTLSAVQ